MKRYDTVIFDLDGTLLNTLDDLANSINHALKTMGFPERTIDEVRRFVGDGALELARRASPAGTSEEMVNQVLEIVQEENQVLVHLDLELMEILLQKMQILQINNKYLGGRSF